MASSELSPVSSAYRSPNDAPENIDDLIVALREAALNAGESEIDWTGKDGLFWRAAEVIEALGVCADAALSSTEGSK